MAPEPDRVDAEVHAALSVSAASLPGGLGRREFLRAVLAAGGSAALLGSCSWGDADRRGAADPGAGTSAPGTPAARSVDGVLVVLQLRGGNDGLNTLVPLGRSLGPYQDARGSIAVEHAIPIDDEHGFHPKLAKLAARYADGRVAVVQGVGEPMADLSHFSSTASWMAGVSGSDRRTGWLGRWADDLPNAVSGLPIVHIGASVPLHLIGRRAAVTALATDVDLFGADRRQPRDRALFETIEAFGRSGRDLGTWGDRIARTSLAALGVGDQVAPLFDTPLGDRRTLASAMALAARVVNADLGVRVVSVLLDGFDLHGKQPDEHARLLGELDDGIEAFHRTLAPAWVDRVALLTFSEFGRRVQANASSGTDHGWAGLQLLVGSSVAGGLHGGAPSLTELNNRGDLRVSTDFRSVYASVLDDWLGADAAAVLGRAPERLRLFRSGPKP